jgi:hypothetical protein
MRLRWIYITPDVFWFLVVTILDLSHTIARTLRLEGMLCCEDTTDEKLTLALGTVINANAFDTTYPFALPHVSGSHPLGFLQANQTTIHSHVRRLPRQSWLLVGSAACLLRFWLICEWALGHQKRAAPALPSSLINVRPSALALRNTVL